MSTIDLREKVRAYVDAADQKLLKMIKALAESYQSDEEEPVLSENDYEVLDRRREAHLNEESKSYSWEEVKENARNEAK